MTNLKKLNAVLDEGKQYVVVLDAYARPEQCGACGETWSTREVGVGHDGDIYVQGSRVRSTNGCCEPARHVGPLTADQVREVLADREIMQRSRTLRLHDYVPTAYGPDGDEVEQKVADADLDERWTTVGEVLDALDAIRESVRSEMISDYAEEHGVHEWVEAGRELAEIDIELDEEGLAAE